MILHVVLLRFRAGISEAQLRSFGQTVTNTCRSIPSIRHAYVGLRAEVDAGYPRQFGETTYDAAAVLHFADRAALSVYLQHPMHRELGRLFWERSDGAVVFETEAADIVSAPLPDDWFSSFRPGL